MNTFQIKSTIGWCKCFVATESVCRAADLNIFYTLWMIKSQDGGKLPDSLVDATGRRGFYGGWGGGVNGASSTMQRGFRCPWEMGREPSRFLCWQCTAVLVPHSGAPHVSPPEGANEQWRGSGCLEHAEGAPVLPGLHGHRGVGAAPGQMVA